jgi:hypothetical protein
VHPATWYKVEFSDHPVVTFRPSAFKIISSDQDFDVLELPSNPILRVTPKASKSSSSASSKFKPTLKSFPANSSTPKSKDGEHEDMDLGAADAMEEEEDSLSNDMADHEEKEMSSETVAMSASHNLTSEIKQKPLILDSIDPEIWIGCKVKVIGGKNHLEEAVIMRTGNGWVQIVTTAGEEVAKRAHELEVLQLPAGVNRPIHHRTGNNLARRKPTGSSHSNPSAQSAVSYDDSGRPRPRRLGLKRGSDGESRQSASGEVSADDCSEARDSVYHWTKELRKSIIIDKMFSCGPTPVSSYHYSSTGSSNRPSGEGAELCRQCFGEMWPGSKFCWNEDCPCSPSYIAHPWRATAPQRMTNPSSILEVAESLDMDTGISQPTHLSSMTSNPSSRTIALYQSTEDTSTGYEEIKKCRSDSTVTDQESPSPELTAQKESSHMNKSSAHVTSILLPSNPTMPFIAYDEKNLGFAFYNPYTAGSKAAPVPTTMSQQQPQPPASS